jgi:hypothetical protein
MCGQNPGCQSKNQSPTHKRMLRIISFAAVLSLSVDAWSVTSNIKLGASSMLSLRDMNYHHRTCPQITHLNMAEGPASEGRRRFLELSAAAFLPMILTSNTRRAAAEDLKADAAAAFLAIPLDITAAIAGGSPTVRPPPQPAPPAPPAPPPLRPRHPRPEPAHPRSLPPPITRIGSRNSFCPLPPTPPPPPA